VNSGKQDANNGLKQCKHWRTRLFCQIWKSSRSCNPFFATHRAATRAHSLWMAVVCMPYQIYVLQPTRTIRRISNMGDMLGAHPYQCNRFRWVATRFLPPTILFAHRSPKD
jgi:hypothetical protein